MTNYSVAIIFNPNFLVYFQSANLTVGTPLYFPMIHKADLLRLAQDLYRDSDLGFLTGQDVLNSCITVTGVQQPVFRLSFYGFCDKSFSKVLTPEEPLVFSWHKLFPGGTS